MALLIVGDMLPRGASCARVTCTKAHTMRRSTCPDCTRLAVSACSCPARASTGKNRNLLTTPSTNGTIARTSSSYSNSSSSSSSSSNSNSSSSSGSCCAAYRACAPAIVAHTLHTRSCRRLLCQTAEASVGHNSIISTMGDVVLRLNSLDPSDHAHACAPT